MGRLASTFWLARSTPASRKKIIRAFVAFLQKLDAAYPPATAIKLIFDNHACMPVRVTQKLDLSSFGQAPSIMISDYVATSVVTEEHGLAGNFLPPTLATLSSTQTDHAEAPCALVAVEGLFGE